MSEEMINHLIASGAVISISVVASDELYGKERHIHISSGRPAHLHSAVKQSVEHFTDCAFSNIEVTVATHGRLV